MATTFNPDTKPRCPRCGKAFARESSVLCHLNQPQSNCRFFYENVVHFQQPPDNPDQVPMPTVQQPDSAPSSPMNLTSEPVEVPMFEDAPTGFDKMDTEDNQPDSEAPCQESLFDHPRADALKYFCEEHPDPSWIRPERGETFMDKFDNNEHAGKRSSNLYYPFATRSEWELAAFLLRSNLSMSSIDEFLKLDLVWFCLLICIFCSQFLSLRSRRLVFPSRLQGISEQGRTFCLQVLAGNHKRYSLKSLIQRNIQSFFIIAIPSNV